MAGEVGYGVIGSGNARLGKACSGRQGKQDGIGMVGRDKAGLGKAGKERRFLPGIADLVDRLTIVQMKAIFLPEHKAEYMAERADIEHDIDLILAEGKPINAAAIHAVIVIMLSNRFIWESESKARAGGNDQDKLLKLTHSINGVRNTAKNQLANIVGGRKDYKIDALAADLPAEFGNWKVFE